MAEHDFNKLGTGERFIFGTGGSIAGTIRMLLFILAFVVIGGGFFYLVR